MPYGMPYIFRNFASTCKWGKWGKLISKLPILAAFQSEFIRSFYYVEVPDVSSFDEILHTTGVPRSTLFLGRKKYSVTRDTLILKSQNPMLKSQNSS